MLKIFKENAIYSMSKEHPPIESCESGDTIIFETMDCFSDQITSEDQLIDTLDFNRVNPATGPLFIKGANVGDVLAVEILDIQVAEQGVMTAAPNLGVLGEEIKEPLTKILHVKDGQVIFNENISVPLKPMIGVIGTAPAEGEINCGTPDQHGGNMDTKEIRPGVTLFLPVHTDGALLALGDLHAAMGDGEILICGVEIAGEVTVKVTVIKNKSLPLPMIKTEDKLITLSSHVDLNIASDQATKDMASFIKQETGQSIAEVGMLMSMAGDLKISQVVDPQKTARFEMPLTILEKLGMKI